MVCLFVGVFACLFVSWFLFVYSFFVCFCTRDKVKQEQKMAKTDDQQVYITDDHQILQSESCDSRTLPYPTSVYKCLSTSSLDLTISFGTWVGFSRTSSRTSSEYH